MLRVLEAQAPPRQNATDTINTLCSRLGSATLLEDRRSAILGLRSFAKQYPASVASGGLRELISTLVRDSADVDTGKIVLETLLMLFNPDENSPEASDDVALWLADEFSQRQDNMKVLLDLLEASEFYPRLYALQLLAAISSARPERTQECILSAPLGTTRLVAILDDPREAVRAAGILLLNDLTQGSPELQKLVAFENAFDRIFTLIKAEGSLTQGGIVVQDCLTLLANLLDLNPSNQSLFRETGFVPRLTDLLMEPTRAKTDEDEDIDLSIRDKNLWGLLAVLRMFLVEGNLGTQANQNAFEKHRVLQLVLDLGFTTSVGSVIRAEALSTCADIIRGNSKIQERFAHNKVPAPKTASASTEANGIQNQKESRIYIIDALLEITLSVPTLSMFDVRFAACQCIQAYFYNHPPIRHHFLRRAIDGHNSGEDETSNILSILINGPRSYQSIDPYRLWFASKLAFLLIYDDTEAKDLAMAIAEGDAASGEEVVTCIQALTGNLIAALQGTDDDRVSIGYLMLLCGWLFEDVDAVNDLLSEGSTVQSIVQATARSDKGKEIVQGLCAYLLGILYEFSTKDSPISRRTLQPLILSGLGRERFVSKITRLREHTSVRDFEVLPQNLSSSEPGDFPLVFYDQTFVNFFKDNFGRILRSVDKEPGIEVARLHEGIDRDLVDSLRSQIEDRAETLDKTKSALLTSERKLGQEQADHKKSQETFNAELARIKNINEALQRAHDAETEQSEAGHRSQLQDLRAEHQKQVQDLNSQIQAAQNEAERRATKLAEQQQSEFNALQREIASLSTSAQQYSETIETLRRTNDSLSDTLKTRDWQLESAKKDKQLLEENVDFNNVSTRKLEDQIKDLETQLDVASKREAELQEEAKNKEDARQSTQEELDGLMLMLDDLVEKRKKDKKQLRELGAEVSDGEDEASEDEDDGGQGSQDEEDEGAEDVE